MKSGSISAAVYDIETAFRYVDTDGKHWIFESCANRPTEITDYRYTLIYKIAKIYYQLQQKKRYEGHRDAPMVNI